MTNNDPTAGQALADIVIGVAVRLERDPARQERTKAPPGSAAEAHPDRVRRQTGMAIASRELARQHRSDSAMDIADLALDAHRLALVERRLRGADQLIVERLVEVMVLPLTVMDHHIGRGRRAVEQPAQIDALRLPMLDRPDHVEAVDP